MFLDYAPMEGITGAVYRRFHHAYFPGVDRYFTPFISPTKDHCFSPRELREILPENNPPVTVIPQLMGKVPEDFLWAAGELYAMGYRELNLNLGCPSGTVTAKGKGSGMLADVEVLDRFLDAICSQSPCALSVKTRLGMENPADFEAILAVYNRYPLTELIVHPRVRTDFYRHPVRIEWFETALRESKNPVSYNGSIITPYDYRDCEVKYPNLRGIMIGQALAADPFLAGRIRSGMQSDRKKLREFHDRLYEEYARLFESRPNAMKRMKEMWVYLICIFADHDRYRKALFKTKTTQEFEAVTASIFRDLELLNEAVCKW